MEETFLWRSSPELSNSYKTFHGFHTALCTRPGFRLWGQVGGRQVRTGRKKFSIAHEQVCTHTQAHGLVKGPNVGMTF